MLDYLGELDKVTKIRIITGARLLNIRFGKEPVAGVLSHSIVNQTLYFGFKATRLITSLLFNGLAASDNNRCSNWAGGFFIFKNRQAGPSADTLKPALTRANPEEIAMAQNNIPLPGNCNNSQSSESNLDSLPLSIQINLTQRNIENLMTDIISQMESLAEVMRELAALRGEAS